MDTNEVDVYNSAIGCIEDMRKQQSEAKAANESITSPNVVVVDPNEPQNEAIAHDAATTGRAAEQELVVARVLLAYLQQKDPAVFQKAKAIVTDDYHAWLEQQSVSSSEMAQLKAIIGESYWNRAKRHLKQHVQQTSENKNQKTTAASLKKPPPPASLKPYATTRATGTITPPAPTLVPTTPVPIAPIAPVPIAPTTPVPIAPTPTTPAAVPLGEDTLHEHNGEYYPVFAHILLRYLEAQNKGLCKVAKDIVNDCMQRNQRKEEGYESVTASVRAKVKTEIGDFYWRQAEVIYERYQQQQQQQQNNNKSNSTKDPLFAIPPPPRVSGEKRKVSFKTIYPRQSTTAYHACNTIMEEEEEDPFDPTPVDKLRRLPPPCDEPDMEGFDYSYFGGL
ncbi:expressed unknown protein [Seminavis robusta]|uniref:Uncharacterized protein n=1 Tax=Seminavis robusta TaxID=568900 RepID=A0A9N8ETK5_9STRA|nr:expressed unknown protein [Seminavis robusta]|eukprot:Sro1782_g297160.1 n/a (392) ;mRNA; f:10453-11738